jgi:hypothetical protein
LWRFSTLAWEVILVSFDTAGRLWNEDLRFLCFSRKFRDHTGSLFISKLISSSSGGFISSCWILSISCSILLLSFKFISDYERFIDHSLFFFESAWLNLTEVFPLSCCWDPRRCIFGISSVWVGVLLSLLMASSYMLK